MSGFEIAGIVLGAFSVLADGVKDAHSPYQKLKRWWSFGIAFEDFLLRLDTERVAFLQNLENLLGSVDISDTQKEALLSDAQCRLWNEPQVQAALRRRITDQYFDWYRTILSDIRDTLEEVNRLLPVGSVHQVDGGSLEDVLFRARTSFFSRKDRLLERIQKRNDEISKFLLRESMQPPIASQTRRPNQFLANSRPFLRSQRKSKELHSALQKVWDCKCHPSHACAITTAPNIHDSSNSSRLSLLVQHQFSHHRIRIEEVEDDNEEKPPTLPAGSTAVQDIPTLRHQLAIKNKSKKLKSPKEVLRVLGKSSISSMLRSFTKGSSHPTGSVSSTEGVVALTGVINGFSSTTTSSTASTITSVCTPSPAPQSKQKVKFATAAVSLTTSASFRVSPLTNLCTSLTPPPSPDSPLGFIQISDRSKLLLYPNYPEPDPSNVQTLGTFLTTTPHRATRVRAGLNMATLLLSLDSPTWIPPNLDKTYIWVVKEPSSTAIPTPYFIQPDILPYQSSTLKPERTQNHLLSLGILLLELLFGQTLEEQPERAGLMGPDGKPNRYTDLCTAIQWQEKVELDVGDGLAEAIRRCLYCDFGVERDMGSASFVQAVLGNVVEPLKEFLRGWKTEAVVGAM